MPPRPEGIIPSWTSRKGEVEISSIVKEGDTVRFAALGGPRPARGHLTGLGAWTRMRAARCRARSESMRLRVCLLTVLLILIALRHAAAGTPPAEPILRIETGMHTALI